MHITTYNHAEGDIDGDHFIGVSKRGASFNPALLLRLSIALNSIKVERDSDRMAFAGSPATSGILVRALFGPYAV